MAALAAAVFIPGALAENVTAQTFELDGNIAANTAGHYDWASFFDANGGKLTLPTNYTASSFVRDFNTTPGRKGGVVFDTSDSSTYTIGSKDILDVNGWSCTPANNVTDKGDIMNAYATAYTAPDGEKFLFFGMERNANAGDANVAFWFLQGSASCPAAGGSFVGQHHNGDLLIVSAFTNGGSVSTIDEYEWQNGALNTTPVAHGQDCSSPSATNDPTCATSNTSAINNIPWLTENKADGVGHTLQTGEFFEGGIDLSAPSVNLANTCFNTFIPDTRSSQSLTATLYDFAIGQLGECTSTTTTQPRAGGDDTSPPANSIPADPAGSNTEASVSVQDKTTIAVTGNISSFNSSNSQNLTWHICGPTDPNSTQLCDGSTGTSTPACSTLPTISCVGVAVGSTSITAPGTADSPTVTLTSAGRYCFRADFAGDSSVGLPGSSDSAAHECFVIGPQQPTLSTQATTGPVDFGSKISDTVTLTGTADKPGSGGPTGSNGTINPTTLGGDATGNIDVTAYGPDSCTTVAFSSSSSSKSIAASGDGSSYGGAGSNFEFQPSAPGTYVFVASYAGDLPNTKAVVPSATACADAPSSEIVVVRKKPTSIATSQLVYPQDSVTITDTITNDNLPVGGVVTFYLYGATSGSTPADRAASALANCQAHTTTVNSGGLLATFSATQSTAGHTFTADTNKQTSVGVSDNTTVYWRDTYDPKNSAFLGIQSDCVENTSTTFVNDSGPGSAFTP